MPWLDVHASQVTCAARQSVPEGSISLFICMLGLKSQTDQNNYNETCPRSFKTHSKHVKPGLLLFQTRSCELFIAHGQCLVKKNNNYLSYYYHSNSTLHFQPIPRKLSRSLPVCLMSTVQTVCVFRSLVFKFKGFQTNKSKSRLFWYRACLWPYKKIWNEDEDKRKVLQIKERKYKIDNNILYVNKELNRKQGCVQYDY